MRQDSMATGVLASDGRLLACSQGLRELMGAHAELFVARLKDSLDGHGPGESWSAAVEHEGERLMFELEAGDGLVLLQARGRELPLREEAFARLADGLVHDVRNPLNALSIHLQLLSDKAETAGLSEALGAHLVAIRKQVGRTEELLRRFLRFASPRPEALTTVDLAGLVQQVVETCSYDARHTGVQVEVALAPTPVACEASRLARAILALVMRGIDHAGAGGQLEVSLSPVERDAVLRVRDTAPTCLEGVGSGSGWDVSLPAAREIVEVHRGNLLTRAEGCLSEVEVRLPLAVTG